MNDDDCNYCCWGYSWDLFLLHVTWVWFNWCVCVCDSAYFLFCFLGKKSMLIKMLSADLPGHVAPKMYIFLPCCYGPNYPSHSASESWQEMPLKELQKDCREMEVRGLHQTKPGGWKKNQREVFPTVSLGKYVKSHGDFFRQHGHGVLQVEARRVGLSPLPGCNRGKWRFS